MDSRKINLACFARLFHLDLKSDGLVCRIVVGIAVGFDFDFHFIRARLQAFLYGDLACLFSDGYTVSVSLVIVSLGLLYELTDFLQFLYEVLISYSEMSLFRSARSRIFICMDLQFVTEVNVRFVHVKLQAIENIGTGASV